MKYQRFIIRSERVRQSCMDAIVAIDIPSDGESGVMQVEIKQYTKHRSLAQNRLYWKFMHQISEDYAAQGGTQQAPEIWSEYFKQLFLGVESHNVRGSVIERTKSTTELDTREFTGYLERIDHFCATELNIQLRHPEDDWLEAMGG